MVSIQARRWSRALPKFGAVTLSWASRSADGGPTGYALRRIDLDAVLLERARQSGVALFEGCVMRQLRYNAQGGVCGISGLDAAKQPVEFHARLVIGADGSHSLTARQL